MNELDILKINIAELVERLKVSNEILFCVANDIKIEGDKEAILRARDLNYEVIKQNE